MRQFSLDSAKERRRYNHRENVGNTWKDAWNQNSLGRKLQNHSWSKDQCVILKLKGKKYSINPATGEWKIWSGCSSLHILFLSSYCLQWLLYQLYENTSMMYHNCRMKSTLSTRLFTRMVMFYIQSGILCLQSVF